jgi:hypothetical protein
MTTATTSAWALEVARDELSRTRLLDLAVPEPAEGEAVLRADRVGMTANNVTYAVIGEAFHYWDFFPAQQPGSGRVPLWGFAEVVASRAEGVDVGARVYGFLPTASHLVVRPDRVDAGGFRDAAPHRAALPAAYNAYALAAGDPSYEPDREDLQVLFRPLFLTSFLLADQLQDTPGTVVLSSASSKTAYGAAFLLRGAGRQVVGLTSPGNLAFTQSLGCYDRVLVYDEVTSLPQEPTAYVDLAGSSAVRQALHEHLADRLALDLVVGVTHQDGGSAGRLPGPRPTVFFAPDRLRQRTEDWGRTGLDERFAQAWGSFVPVVEGWVDVTTGSGPQALEAAYLEVLSGRSDPRTGHVLRL